MRNWIAVASAEHVRRGREAGFMQVCHGKGGPLRRVLPGHRVVYYSPTETYHGKDRIQALTALGVVKADAPYQVDMGDGFCPFRRNVDWCDAHETPIRPLLERLEFAAGGKWGAKLRFGLFTIDDCDFEVIAAAMRAPGLQTQPPPVKTAA